jgi:hypothetical protein
VLLQQFAVRPLDDLSFFGLPLLGIALGLGLAAWAPLGRGRAASTTPAASSPSSAPAPATEPELPPEVPPTSIPMPPSEPMPPSGPVPPSPPPPRGG